MANKIVEIDRKGGVQEKLMIGMIIIGSLYIELGMIIIGSLYRELVFQIFLTAPTILSAIFLAEGFATHF